MGQPTNTGNNNGGTNKMLKQIIDGCDVSGCECYSAHREGYCGWFIPCEGDSCQYKLDWALQQLKAKEQECEELKKTVDDLLHKPEIQNKILWKIDNEALLGSKDAWIYKLRQALTEIKEIAEIRKDDINDWLAKEILQKCEVVNE